MSSSRDAAFVCATFLGFDVDIGDNEKEIGMSKVVSDFRDRCMKEGELLGMEKGKLLGMEEGKLLGMEEGTRKAIRGIVERLIRKSLGIHEISSLIGVSEEAVKEIELSMGQ